MFNNNLKFCREELEMTQNELGFVFGVHHTTISGWETGKDTIPLKKLIKFCNLYNYSLDFACGLKRKNEEFTKVDTKNIKNTIGNNLKKIRKKLGLTQNDISNICMISQSAYNNYELGKQLIGTLTLYTICKKFNISMDILIGRKKKTEKVLA